MLDMKAEPDGDGGSLSAESPLEMRLGKSTGSISYLTARAMVSVGEATNLPYLKGLAGLAQLIIETTDVSTASRSCRSIFIHRPISE